MIRVIVHGAGGRMGRMLCRLLREDFSSWELAAQVSPSLAEDGENCYRTLAQVPPAADCVVDFSHHSTAPALMTYCREHRLPVVVATTGHTPEEMAAIHAAAAAIPVFFSANMSVGVAYLAEMGKKAAALFPQAEIEIIERHHDQKLDVPSGTALLLADRIGEVRPDAPVVTGRRENGKRDPREITIHSLRLGNKVGTHEIILSTGSETITLRHEAEDRTLFANGAMAAIRFLLTQPAGLYGMSDMLTQ